MFRIVAVIFTFIYSTLFFHPELCLTFQNYDLLNFIIYWSISIWYFVSYKKDDIFCFELLFIISYWFACFLGFIIDLKGLPYIGEMLFSYSPNIINKAHALAMVGFLVFIFSASISVKKTVNMSLIKVNRNKVSFLNNLSLILLFIFIVTGGYNLIYLYSLKSVSSSRMMLISGVWQYLFIFYTITSIYNFEYVKHSIRGCTLIELVKKLPRKYILLSIIFIILLFLSGLRSALLQVLLPIIFLYTLYVKNIKPIWLISGIIVGALIMSIVGQIRSESMSLENMISVDIENTNKMAQDYLPANGALYFFIKYVDKNGITYGTNQFLQIASFIPFLQKALVFLFGQNIFTNSSSSLYTDIMGLYEGSGLGTNLVADSYYSFGYFGVLIIMYFLAWIVKKSFTNRNNLIYLYIYLTLLGNSIFGPRVETFYIIRNIGFGIIIIYLINSFSFQLNKEP